MERHASANWKGTIKSGKGSIDTESGALDRVSYSFGKRFGGEKGTNPEELVAAAHAACFSMAMAAELEKENFEAEQIETSATVTIERHQGGWSVTSSHIDVEAIIPGISDEEFNKVAEQVKNNCPISRLLDAEITLSAQLNGKERTQGSSPIPREMQQWNG